jgi:hypothetical protein
MRDYPVSHMQPLRFKLALAGLLVICLVAMRDIYAYGYGLEFY